MPPHIALLIDEVRLPNFVGKVPRVTDDAVGRREQQTMALEMPILRNSGQRIGECLANVVNLTLEGAGVVLDKHLLKMARYVLWCLVVKLDRDLGKPSVQEVWKEVTADLLSLLSG
jgi:hypothetical protein